MNDYACPRCLQMNLKYEGPFAHSPYSELTKMFTCNFCQQKFMVVDDGKDRHEAFLSEG